MSDKPELIVTAIVTIGLMCFAVFLQERRMSSLQDAIQTSEPIKIEKKVYKCSEVKI